MDQVTGPGSGHAPARMKSASRSLPAAKVQRNTNGRRLARHVAD